MRAQQQQQQQQRTMGILQQRGMDFASEMNVLKLTKQARKRKVLPYLKRQIPLTKGEISTKVSL